MPDEQKPNCCLMVRDTNDEYHQVNPDEITLSAALGKKSVLHVLRNGILTIHHLKHSLKWMETQLKVYPQFMKAHRGIIINVTQIKTYLSRSHWMTMNDNTSFTVGKTFYRKVKERLKLLS